MAVVILPKDHVYKAAAQLAEARTAARRGGPATDEDNMLEGVIDTALWLERMDVPDAQIGLTLAEAKLIEPLLPVYNE